MCKILLLQGANANYLGKREPAIYGSTTVDELKAMLLRHAEEQGYVVGGTSVAAHGAGLERIVQAGAQPISWVALAGELQRDWARVDTAPAVVDIVLTSRLLKGE